MDAVEFEAILERLCELLTDDVRTGSSHHKPALFEARVRERLSECLAETGRLIALDPVVQGFPDIIAGSFGVEVKATESDNWRCIANSVSEGSRSSRVKEIYLVYGKMGGTPQVRWGRYGDCIVHVRTSHVPRFEVEIGSSKSLFRELGVEYSDFQRLPMDEKMPFIRSYARKRLGPGERLWWLEDREPEETQHSLPLSVKIYTHLPKEEKRKLRAEATLMCPEIVAGGRKRGKYDDATMYLMTYRGVLCPQTRDLFSAGSVAGKDRGGHYLSRALIDIQSEIRDAAQYLEPQLFEEYWGKAAPPPPGERLLAWLDLADRSATDWRPSDILFLAEQGRD